jgi:hypothetical protein
MPGSFDGNLNRIVQALLASGVVGTTLRSGAGVPSDSLGNNNDWYLRTTDGSFYTKQSGAYTLVANLIGPAGTPGAKGDKGDTGSSGSTGAAGSNWDDGTRAYYSRLPIITGVGTSYLVNGTAYWLYCGQVSAAKTVVGLTSWVDTAATGVGSVCAVALASTPNAPNRAGQTLTKLGTASTFAPTSTGLMRPIASFAAAIAAGTHLWCGIKTTVVTLPPTFRSVTDDLGQGAVLVTTGAGSFSSTASWVGSVPGATAAAVAPYMTATLD